MYCLIEKHHESTCFYVSDGGIQSLIVLDVFQIRWFEQQRAKRRVKRDFNDFNNFNDRLWRSQWYLVWILTFLSTLLHKLKYCML